MAGAHFWLVSCRQGSSKVDTSSLMIFDRADLLSCASRNWVGSFRYAKFTHKKYQVNPLALKSKCFETIGFFTLVVIVLVPCIAWQPWYNMHNERVRSQEAF